MGPINDNYKHHYGLVSDEIVTNVFQFQMFIIFPRKKQVKNEINAVLTTVNAFLTVLLDQLLFVSSDYTVVATLYLSLACFRDPTFAEYCNLVSTKLRNFLLCLIDFLIILGE